MYGPEAFGGWPRDVDWWLAFLPGPDQEDEAPSAYGKFVDAFIELVRERGPRVAQELLNEFVRMYGGKEPRPKSPGRPRRTTPEQAMSYSRAKKRTKKQYLTADLTDPDDERNERKALRLEKKRYDEERSRFAQEKAAFNDQLRQIGVSEDEIVRAAKRATQRAAELHWLLWGQKSLE